jgi:hypothetical protein
MNPDNPDSWIKFFMYGAFASFGGVMGYAMRTIHNAGKVTFCRGVIEGASAGFVGMIVCLLCQAMKLSDQWTGVCVGVFGWMGANVTMMLLEKIVVAKFGLPQETSANDNPES